MKLIVLDASVAIKWFVEDEAGRAAALRILADIEASAKNYVVPELFFCEMVAVLCRLSKDSDKVTHYLNLLENLGFHRIGHGSELLTAAIELSCTQGLSGYDAIYAATAKLISGVWLTADERAHKKMGDKAVSVLLDRA